MSERKVREILHFPSSLPALYKNVAIYVRVSSVIRPQIESLAAQASGLVQKVSKNYGWRLVDIYIDIRSGEDSKHRPEYTRMMEDAAAQKIDLIITKSISRFGRNTEEAIMAIRELSAHNVSVLFDEENINSGEVGSEFIISILSAYAEGENESRRRNQLWSIQKRLEDGTSEIYTRECYGYRKSDDGTLTIYEPEAEVVREVFDLYLSGASVYMIQKHLAAEGIKTAKGKDKWSKLAIEKMLSNEKYIGDIRVAKPQGRRKGDFERDGGYYISDAHPAIILRDVFEAVQEEKKRRSNIIVDETGTHRKTTRYSYKREKKDIEESR